jgi:hypothetical protein
MLLCSVATGRETRPPPPRSLPGVPPAAGFKGTGALEGGRAAARCPRGQVIKGLQMPFYGRLFFGCKAPTSYK